MLDSVGTTAEKYAGMASCGYQMYRAAATAAVGSISLLVVHVILGFVKRRSPIRATILSASDTHSLERIQATVNTRTETKQRRDSKGRRSSYTVTYYDVMHAGGTLRCRTRQDASLPFPQRRGGGIECQTGAWNGCEMTVQHGETTYSVLKSGVRGACAPFVGREDTFYLADDGSVVDNNNEAYVRLCLRILRALLAYAVPFSLFRLVTIPSVCNFSMVASLQAAEGTALSDFARVYDVAFKLDRAEEALELAGELGSSIPMVVTGTGAASSLLKIGFLFKHLETDFHLWRAATGGEEMGEYVQRLLRFWVGSFAVGFAVGGLLAWREVPSDTKGRPWLKAIVPVAGVVAGVAVASQAMTYLRGRDRQRIGLSFVDVPRMVL